MSNLFEDEPKAKCPECSQPLTFVRTKSHEKRWYCYSCEKYVDRFADVVSNKDAHARLEALNGLQVIDSHGMIIGRVRKAIPNDTGDVRSLLLSVDKEQFKTLLDDRDLPREFEIAHDRIATVGDVVILSSAFSLNALAPPRPPIESPVPAKCDKCGSTLLADAKHCIICGATVHTGSCPSCGTANPAEAKYCKNCGNRIS